MKRISLLAVSITLILGSISIGCQQNDQAQLTEAKLEAEFDRKNDSLDQEIFAMIEEKFKELEERGISRDSALKIWKQKLNQEFAEHLTSRDLDADSVIQAQGLKVE